MKIWSCLKESDIHAMIKLFIFMAKALVTFMIGRITEKYTFDRPFIQFTSCVCEDG